MQIVGHRGVKALCSENTMPSFQMALDYGLDGIEVDVWRTIDGHLVLIHDETVDRTTNGHGKVTLMTLDELRMLDAGGLGTEGFVPVPLLSEFLALMSGKGLLCNIEMKDKRLDVLDQTVALIQEYDVLDNLVITSFHPEVTKRAEDKHGLKTQGFPKNLYGDRFVDDVYSHMHAVGIPMADLTPESAAYHKSLGLEAWAWCPDTHDAVVHAKATGASLITVNDPRPAIEILR